MGREGLHPGCGWGTEKLLWAIMLLSMAWCSRKIHTVHAAPVLGPDLTRCKPIMDNDRPLDCCFLPPKRPEINFRFNTDLPIRVRRSTHNVDQAYVERLDRAYELMKALPDDDPRSFLRQSNIHCAYCARVYRQANSTAFIDVHLNWLLFPFHRWYVYFHERILASLLGDDTFALPFWQWDNQADVDPPSNQLPSMYVDRRNLGLFHEKRSAAHQPPAIIDLSYSKTNDPAAPVASPEDQRAINRNVLYTGVVSASPTPSLFLGAPYRSGDDPPTILTTFEAHPHGAVHFWTGDERSSEPFADMGPPVSAARDPVFFAHHANVDRLWDLWKTLPGGQRGDLTDPDWLNSEFVFYDENADLVRVTVADSLDMEKFRYKYEEVENDWLWFNSTRLSTRPAPVSVSPDCAPEFLEQLMSGIAKLARFIVPSWQTERTRQSCDLIATRGPEMLHVRNITLTGAVFQAHISRPVPMIIQTRKPEAFELQQEDQGYQEEVLAIEGIRIPSDKPVGFVLFLNLPEADEHTPWSCTEYAGAFYTQSLEQTPSPDHSFRVGISSKLKQLGLEKEPSILVSLVPRSKDRDDTIIIQSIRIELANNITKAAEDDKSSNHQSVAQSLDPNRK